MAKYVNSDGLTYYNNKIKALLDGKASTGHTHAYSSLTGLPSLGNASSKSVRTLSAAGASGWKDASTDDGYVPTMTFMAYWNGAYSGSSSNLAYCNRGAFGTIVTKNTGDYAAASHTHKYAGSSSAGGSANSVANSLSIQLNGGTATSFNGSAAKSINITASSIGAAASSHSHNQITLMGSDSITARSQDTQANWAKVGNSVHYFSKESELIDQKNQYGFVCNITNGADVHQFWTTQPTGHVFHRGANANGWSGSWRKIIDDTDVVATKSTSGCLNTFNTDWTKIASLNTLAYWDGAHSTSTDGATHYSSLSYCIKGAFGSSVTRNMVSGIYTASPLSAFTSVWKDIPDVNLLAYWNGRWNANNSNLQYCNKGAFGTGAIRNISGNITVGTAAPSGTATNGDIYIQYA